MSDQGRDHLLDHSYDGIQEYDNPMPRWWVYIFWGTIAFSVLYVINVGPFGVGRGRIANYEAEMAAAAKLHPQGGGQVDVAALLAATKNAGTVAAGKTVFTTNCAACHRADGGGLIGPNLTDKYWLHGGTIADIYRTVNDGVLAKGMPAWGKVLKPADVTAATAYVASLRGTNPTNPKAPQGDPVEP